MRLLLISRSATFDGTSSLANVPRLVVQRMIKEDPNLFVQWLVPRRASDEQLAEFLWDDLTDDEKRRLKWVKATGHGFERMIGYFSTEEIWDALNQARTKIPYDVVVTQQAALVPTYRSVLMNRYRASRYTVAVPWTIWHLWTATLSQMEEVPEYYMGEPDVLAELTGCYAAELNVWESNYLLQDALRSMRKWYQPSTIRKVMESSVPVHVGVDTNRLDETLEMRRKRAKEGGAPGLVWGGRFANQKKAKITLPLMHDVQTMLLASGLNVPVTVCSSMAIPDWATEKYTNFVLNGPVERREWMRWMGQGDVFMCNSVSEGYGTAWLEMLGAGVMGVFERSWWNEQLLPDWYPFVVDTHEEQKAMTAELLRTWPDGPMWQYEQRIVDWVREEHSDLVSGPRMLHLLKDQFEKAVESNSMIGRGTVAQLAEQAALSVYEGEPLPEDAVWQQMGALSDSDREWGRHGDIVSRMYLRRCLQSRGWTDLCTSEDVLFVPPEKP